MVTGVLGRSSPPSHARRLGASSPKWGLMHARTAGSRDTCAGWDSGNMRKSCAGAILGFSLYEMGMQRLRKACRSPVLQAVSEALDNADDKAVLPLLRTGETHHSSDEYSPVKDDGASLRGPYPILHTVRTVSPTLNHPTSEFCSEMTSACKDKAAEARGCISVHARRFEKQKQEEEGSIFPEERLILLSPVPGSR